MRDGTLEKIYRKWGIWDDYQPAFFASVLNENAEESGGKCRGDEGIRHRGSLIPALLRASLIRSSVVRGDGAGGFRRASSSPAAAFTETRWCARCSRSTSKSGAARRCCFNCSFLYYGLFSVIRLPAYHRRAPRPGLNYAAVRK